MDNNTIKKNEELTEIKNFFEKNLKYWYWIGLSVVICLGIAFVYLKVTNPVYQVNASILVKDEEGGEGSGGLQSALIKNVGLGLLGKSNVEDELHILGSHTVLRNAVKTLELNKIYQVNHFLKKEDCFKNSPVEISLPVAVIDTLSHVFTFKLKVNDKGYIHVKTYVKGDKISDIKEKTFPVVVSTEYGTFTLNSTPFYKPEKSLNMTIQLTGYDLAAEWLSQSLSLALASRKANVITLTIEETNIVRGKDLLNTIIDIFNKDGIKDKNVTAENTALFLDTRLNIIYEELKNIEKNVEDYKKENNLTDIQSEARIILEQNGNFKEKLIQVETESAVVDLLEDYLADPHNKFNLIPASVAVTDKSVVETIQEYNKILLERNKLAQATFSTNPSLLQLNDQVEAMRKNVVLSVNNVKKGILISKADLQKQEDEFKARIKGMPTQEREFINIERQRMIKEQLFIFLMEKKEENALTLAITAPKAKVIDTAYNINEPLKPKKSIILLAGLVLGILIPFLIFYFLEVLKTKIDTKESLEKITDISVLGEICQNHSSQKLVVKVGESSSISELFRLIRTNLQFVMNSKDEKVILVTSSISGEGKSFVSSNFALSLAILKKKVVLVGLDIRSPKLLEYLNLPDKKIGITNYLADENLKPEDIILRLNSYENVDVIPGGPIPPNPSELLLSDRLDDLFNYLRNNYDYVIVDTAPVAMVSDTFVLDRVADATIYVCRANYTDKSYIKYATALAKNGRFKKLSFVINGTKGRQGYGYGYGHKSPAAHNK